ncbi:MAG: hypothetical protein ACTSQJ_03770 [Promethearchaeota archaeon]
MNKEKDIRVILPIGIIYEVIAGILNKPYGGFEKANKALELFMRHRNIEIYYNTEDSFQEVQKIFKLYKNLSLVDSTIVFFYINKRCNILFSTDKHYNSCSFINRLLFPV